MIPDDAVERVREAADIVEVVGEHVKLRRSGSDWRGPCPFHQGKNPNFAVSPRKGIYHCYKCGVSGDVITFLREREGLSFVDAVKQLGQRYGVPVPESGPRGGPRERDAREPLWEALGAAADFFRDQLWEAPAGAAARDYLAKRSIDRDLADRFGLGFAPRDGEALRARLHSLGMDDDRQLEVGLLVRRDDGSVRPRFRDRLIFPITDAAGHMAGFGGRLLGPGEPKYLNSPETRVFVKGRLLYNLHQAKQAVRRDDRVLVVEGYFDAIRLAQHGFEGAVAPLGTALSEAQAQLLARYTKNVFLLYDSDEAGLKATFRAGLELLRQGVAVRVVSLPAGEDPDTFLAKQGAERFERHLGEALDLFERQLQIVERQGWFANLSRKRRAVDRLIPTIRAAADPLTRDLYLGRLAERTGIDRATLQREVDDVATTKRSGTQNPSSAEPASTARRESSAHGDAGDPQERAAPGRFAERVGTWQRSGKRKGVRWVGRGGRSERSDEFELVDRQPPRPGVERTRDSERTLVLAMLHLEGYIESIAEKVEVESFRDPVYAELFAALSARGDSGDVAGLADDLSPPAVAEMERLLACTGELTAPKQMVADSVAKLAYFELEDVIDALESDIRGLNVRKPGGWEDAVRKLEEEKLQHIREKMSLGVRANWKVNRTEAGGSRK
jgi:DNA primase